MSELFHEIDLDELGDAIAPIRDSIRKLFEDAYVSIDEDPTVKNVNTFYEKTKEQSNGEG